MAQTFDSFCIICDSICFFIWIKPWTHVSLPLDQPPPAPTSLRHRDVLVIPWIPVFSNFFCSLKADAWPLLFNYCVQLPYFLKFTFVTSSTCQVAVGNESLDSLWSRQSILINWIEKVLLKFRSSFYPDQDVELYFSFLFLSDFSAFPSFDNFKPQRQSPLPGTPRWCTLPANTRLMCICSATSKMSYSYWL